MTSMHYMGLKNCNGCCPLLLCDNRNVAINECISMQVDPTKCYNGSKSIILKSL